MGRWEGTCRLRYGVGKLRYSAGNSSGCSIALHPCRAFKSSVSTSTKIATHQRAKYLLHVGYQ